MTAVVCNVVDTTEVSTFEMMRIAGFANKEMEENYF